MNFKLTTAAVAACIVLTGTAFAESPRNRDRASTSSASGGVAVAGPDGAAAGGLARSRAEQRRDRRGMNRQRAACLPGSVSTSTTGAVYTDRRHGSAAINTSGTAAGSGTVRSSSEGDVYSSTDRTGSQADAYGNSTAVAREPTRRC